MLPILALSPFKEFLAVAKCIPNMSNRKDPKPTQGNRIRGSSSAQNECRPNDEEDDIIKLPACDLDAAAERFKLTLIGREFQLKSRSIDALINLLPKPRIWNVEGRVRGTNLGNGRFQFDFDNEQDLQAVLNKRPCHFNLWSFSLERWEPFTREDFPNSIPFWITVTGVPVHFWNDGTFSEIAKALGKKLTLDSKRAKMQVSINVDNPLQFERRVGFPNGDVGRVTFEYDGLHRHCFNCNYISHDENSCPLLTEQEREQRRLRRLEINTNGDKKLQIELPSKNLKRPRSPPTNMEGRLSFPAKSRREEWRDDKRQRHVYSEHRDHAKSYQKGEKQSFDHPYPRSSGRNVSRRLDVWQRIEQTHKPLDSGSMPRHNSSSTYQGREGNRYISNSNQRQSEWRPRTYPHPGHEGEPRRSVVRSLEQTGISDSVTDSQRTISERLNGLELGEIPCEKTEEQIEQRRLKGKAIVSATPTSKEKDRGAWNPSQLAPLSIREPTDRNQSTEARHAMQVQTNSPTKALTTKQCDAPPKDTMSDMEIDKEDEAAFNAMVMTKDDFETLDKSVREFENLGMDDEMLDNDDLLGEELEKDEEQIEALSQLSPAHNEYQEEPQDKHYLDAERKKKRYKKSLAKCDGGGKPKTAWWSISYHKPCEVIESHRCTQEESRKKPGS